MNSAAEVDSPRRFSKGFSEDVSGFGRDIFRNQSLLTSRSEKAKKKKKNTRVLRREGLGRWTTMASS